MQVTSKDHKNTGEDEFTETIYINPSEVTKSANYITPSANKEDQSEPVNKGKRRFQTSASPNSMHSQCISNAILMRFDAHFETLKFATFPDPERHYFMSHEHKI